MGAYDSPEQRAEETVAAGDGLVDVEAALALTELASQAIQIFQTGTI